jgi:hypothetical protein
MIAACHRAAGRGAGTLGAAVALWLLAVAAGWAQAVTVRSGAHDGFTRLVLTFAEPAAWAFGRTPDGYELRLEGTAPQFDLSQVYGPIGRERLRAIWSDPSTGALRLGVGCACHAVAFGLRGDIMVIDLRTGPPPPRSGFELALDAPLGPALPPLTGRDQPRPRPRPAGPPAAPAADAPAVATASPAAPPALPLPLPPEPSPPVVPAKAPGPAPAETAAPRAAAAALAVGDPAFRAALDRPADPRVTGLDAALLRQVSRAAAQGLVDPAVRLPMPSRPGAPADPAPSPAAAAPAAAADGPQMRILPGADAEDSGLTSDGRACPSAAELDLSGWGDDEAPATALARYRGHLLGEFDRPDAAAGGRLARYYLHLGFGAEARNTLTSLAPDDPQRAMLDTLGFLVDGLAGPAGHPFTGMETCNGPAALWAVLAKDRLDPGGGVDRAAVARSFAALPGPLRQHLGPRLADLFLGAGDDGTVRLVRDAMARAPGGEGAPHSLVAARLEAARGNPDAAAPPLREVVADDGPLAPAALAALVDSVLAAGGRPDPGTVLSVEAALREQGDTAEGRLLRRALALSQAAEDAYDDAFATAVSLDAAVGAELWAMLAARGSMAPLLTHAVRALPPDPAPPRATRRALADRLLEAGFPEAALAWLDAPFEAAEPEDRLRAARAALALRDGRAALRALAGLAAEPAEALRAEALTMIGDIGTAQAAWVAAGQPGRAIDLGWRAAAWDRLPRDAADLRVAGALPLLALAAPPQAAAGDDASVPGEVAAARVAPGEAAAVGPAPASLRRARDLLADAASTRAAVDGLLASLPAP